MKLVDAEQLFCSDCEYKERCKNVTCDVKAMPTIDAVPVVRCARCRHGEAFKTFPGGIFCPYIKDTVPPDGYCYMGEEDHYD